jgi:hypothetical protein
MGHPTIKVCSRSNTKKKKEFSQLLPAILHLIEDNEIIKIFYSKK